MYIRDLYKPGKTVFSLEIFPPKKESPAENLLNILERVTNTKPDFVSVTYGASGNTETKKHSQVIAELLKNQYGTEPLFHLTCINNSKEQIQNILDDLESAQIQNILALRGDIPKNEKQVCNDYSYAVDLIREIKKHGDFCVGAACYPEGHISEEIHSRNYDVLKEKEDAGADFFISQLFFENKHFLNFREKAVKSGVKKPLVAGIMPILNKNQVNRMIFMCGVSLPSEIVKILNRYEDSPEDIRLAGIEYALKQAEKLIRDGVDGIHLYTMNQPDIAEMGIERFKSI